LSLFYGKIHSFLLVVDSLVSCVCFVTRDTSTDHLICRFVKTRSYGGEGCSLQDFFSTHKLYKLFSPPVPRVSPPAARKVSSPVCLAVVKQDSKFPQNNICLKPLKL